MKVLYIICLTFILPILASAQNASLKGRVVDAMSNEPLPFVNVIISGTTTGAITDLNGDFIISGLKPGFVRVEASFVGYKRAVSSEVEVSVASTNTVEIEMEQQREQIEEVTVTASPFRKTEESPVSLRSIGLGEIEKSPGANRDISRVIQSFPGVQSTPAYRNDVIIRGGGPSESRFYLDGVEVPFINHFATQGASGGPVGIINADFLREVDYYSGAFPANRGNALSGVLEFFQVDGNRDRLKFQGTLGASELAATLDGPVGEKTTFIFSARRSYLQFLFSVLELPFLPNFTDMQFKVRSRLNKKNELTFIGLGAFDVFDLNLDIENPDEQQSFILSQIPVNEQWNYTVGAVYKHFSNTGYQTVVLSRSHLNNGAYKYFDNDDSSEENKILDYSSEEIENKIRFENTIRMNGTKLNFGANLDFVTYTNATQQRRFYGDGILNVDYNTSLNVVKWGLFAQASRKLFREQLTLSLGLRADANNYSSSMSNLLEQFSPRFSASYNLTSRWSVNFNAGRYYQLPSYTTLGFKQNGELINKENDLTYISSDHLIGGLEFRPKQTVLFTLEGFWKGYKNYPFSVKDNISLANKGADYGVVGDEEVLSQSEGRAYGAEFQARVNASNGFNLNLSYTLVRSEFLNGTNEYIPTGWDSRHLLNITSTTELKKNWSIGGRWRFVGGLPYTPYDMERSSLVEAWNLTGSPYFDFARLNAERFAAFHQLDVRVDKAYYLNKVTMKFYLDIQNMYSFKAEQQDIIVRATDDNGNFILTDNETRYLLRRVKNSAGTVLPTIGIILQF
ncbi:Outer membrane receptor for ferrienterochelin and colicins [Mariniphaga anaerophila]|uniref:Outer membrane receptor for ferrienterochelin and colicins n=1 Tax=Mariniphaga anaerophila TaxID=1484053 RepID=A0A1M5CFP7_9BACT|nr:TonB-dependent receptor [Mariniphaga anaerophila]SHF53437.1 Outer membrane receptor for ferrienterochelin and colicins [Mariniphaga anaerophila]